MLSNFVPNAMKVRSYRAALYAISGMTLISVVAIASFMDDTTAKVLFLLLPLVAATIGGDLISRRTLSSHRALSTEYSQLPKGSPKRVPYSWMSLMSFGFLALIPYTYLVHIGNWVPAYGLLVLYTFGAYYLRRRQRPDEDGDRPIGPPR